jgi:transcriptional regulator with XRE-family HTH domain
MKTITEQIRQIAERDGRTAYAIARDAGVNPSQVLRFLDGHGATSPTLDKIAEALDLEVKQRTKRKG